MEVSARHLEICEWKLGTMVKAIYRYRLGIHLELIHVIHISGVSVKESLVVSNRN